MTLDSNGSRQKDKWHLLNALQNVAIIMSLIQANGVPLLMKSLLVNLTMFIFSTCKSFYVDPIRKVIS